MDKFNLQLNKILNEIKYPIIHNILNTHKSFLFCESVKQLLLEDYNIFPVPKLLLDNIEHFVRENIINIDNIPSKKYLFNDILNKYTTNWKYYQQFKENTELMLKHNIHCSIIVFLYKTKEQIIKITNKYKPINDIDLDKILNEKALIYSYGNKQDFNCCLLVNYKYLQTDIRKIIQHELIHWQQVTLNSETNKTYGIFNNKQFNLTYEQIKEISYILQQDTSDLKDNFEYLLSGKEFEAWVANVVDELKYNNISLEKYKKVIEDPILFFKSILKYNESIKEILLFGKICYLSSLNDNKDDRYWYLIEAIKSNDNM